MFCTKCGKQIDYNSTVCNECARAENSFFDASQQYNTYPQPPIVEPTPEPKKGSRMVGFGGALASAILGEIAAAFGIIAFLFSVGGFVDALTAAMLADGAAAFEEIAFLFNFVSGDLLGFCAFFVIGAIVMGIIAIVKGAKSIKVFRESSPKPIATFILGLVGIVGSALAFILLFYVVFAIILIAI